eukprot:6780047-Pyramimonas_sp.AAC.1
MVLATLKRSHIWSPSMLTSPRGSPREGLKGSCLPFVRLSLRNIPKKPVSMAAHTAPCQHARPHRAKPRRELGLLPAGRADYWCHARQHVDRDRPLAAARGVPEQAADPLYCHEHHVPLAPRLEGKPRAS